MQRAAAARARAGAGRLPRARVPRQVRGREQSTAATTSTSTEGLTSWRGRHRFYQDVNVVPSSSTSSSATASSTRAAQQPSSWFTVQLDGRSLRTPGMRDFEVPNRTLAVLVAQEWDAQVCVLETSLMPLTMQCAAAIDITPFQRPFMLQELLRYLTTDIVCFPQLLPASTPTSTAPAAAARALLLASGNAEEEQDSIAQARVFLREQQSRKWASALAHFELTYGKLDVLDHDTLRAPKHEQATVERVRARLEKLSDWKLTAALDMAKGCKSLVVPLALMDERISCQEAFDAARVEEQSQIERWGLVEGAHDVDSANLLAQLASAALLFRLSE